MISSYMTYISAVLFATLFAALAQKLAKRKKNGKEGLNPFFWSCSMVILIMLMGFRGNTIGVDDLNYLRGYEIANSINFFQYYSMYTTEPGFYLLYRIVYTCFDNFQWLIIITSFITVVLFYKAIAYDVNKISAPLAVFIFATTQYFYYFGIIRLGLAASIIAYSYRFILENKNKKFIYFVLLSTCFHYSALFALILLFIEKNSGKPIEKSTIWKMALIIPMSFVAVKFLIFPFITASRYQNYINSSEVFSLNFITSIPLLMLFMFNYRKFEKNHQFYFILLIIKVITEIFSPLLGISRMVWYVNLCLVFLFPALLRASKSLFTKYIIFMITLIYSIVYSYNAYFGDSFRGMYMLPYNFFFN